MNFTLLARRCPYSVETYRTKYGIYTNYAWRYSIIYYCDKSNEL